MKTYEDGLRESVKILCSNIVKKETAVEYKCRILNKINKLLNPAPATETVEIGGWICQDCGSSSRIEFCQCGCDSRNIYPFTGTVIRPVKPKVKRREEVGVIEEYRIFKRGIPMIAKLYAEWEE